MREGTAFNAAGEAVPGAIDGDTKLFYLDLYGRYKKGPISIGAEYVLMGGTIGTNVCINAVKVPDGFTNPLPNPAGLDGENDIMVNMGALEIEGKYDFGGRVEIYFGICLRRFFTAF